MCSFMPIFRQKSAVRKRFSPLKQNSDSFNTSNPLGFSLVEGRTKKTLHSCFHPGNNTRFFLNCLCRWLSDLLGHLLASISSVQVSELLGKGKACTVKSFHRSYSAMTVYLMLSCLPLLQTPFHHTDPGSPGEAQSGSLVASDLVHEAWKSSLPWEWPSVRKQDLEHCRFSGKSLHLLPGYPGGEGKE